MTKLKFRAWDKLTKKMYSVDHIDFAMNQVKIALYTDPQHHPMTWYRKFEDVELMLFTGLCDKYGVEIYEGDIVFNSNSTFVTLPEDKRLYCVEWQDGQYDEDGTWLQKNPGFIFKKIKFNNKIYMSLIFSQKQIDVIGNIYSNPELLKGEK